MSFQQAPRLSDSSMEGYGYEHLKDVDAGNCSCQHQKRLERNTRCARWRLPTMVAMLCMLGIALLFATWTHSTLDPVLPIPLLVPDEITAFSLRRFFLPDRQFNPKTGTPTSEHDKAWNAVHPRQVVIGNPSQHGLPTSREYPGRNNTGVYNVSAFHQLHCLRLIRDAWYEIARRGSAVLTDTDSAAIPDNHFHKPTSQHVDHCFEILRQAVTCFADPSLEPIVEDDGITIADTASGWGSDHICRDLDKLGLWILENGP